ncbi:MAG: hypothetical protein CMF12_12090 [Idiomarina sp.]|uniref:VWA domain-containing protein n=1 Tax=Idiomarina sp. TaxID=1874361 RepID=UPI000C4A51AE|nr:VWA domain-containing protein [Idiomarina sp.]MBT43254.1 hypothetical protein [Idiomarina sp.]
MYKLEKQLKAITQVLSFSLGNFNVEVNIGGNKAYHFFDGKAHKINLPAGDFSDPEYYEMCLGYIYHEIGHGIHTDSNVGYGEKTQAMHQLHNALEDVWMERAQGRLSGGAKKRLYRMVELGRKHGIFAGSEKHTPYEAMLFMCLYRGRSRILGNPVDDFAQAREAELRAMVGDAVTDKVIAAVDELETCESTQAAYDIAKKIFDILQFEKDQPQEPESSESQDSDSQDGSSGETSNETSNSSNEDTSEAEQQEQSSSGNGEGEDESKEQNGNSQSPEGSDESDGDETSDNQSNQGESSEGKEEADSDTQDSDGESRGEGKGSQGSGDSNDSSSSQSSSEGELSQEKIKEALEKILGGEGVENVKDFHDALAEKLEEMGTQAQVEGRAFDMRIPSVLNEELLRAEDLEIDLKTRRNISQVYSVLNKALVDQARTLDIYTQQGKTLSRRKLSSIQAGDFNAFLRKGENKATTAAVSILVDKSSSMRTDRMNTANLVAYAVAEGLSKGSVPIEVLYFSDSSFYRAKSFAQKRPQAERFAIASSGGTPTAEGVTAATLSLSQQKADNKVMFVVTDGRPNNPGECAKAIRIAMDAGIKVIPILIGMSKMHVSGLDLVDCVEVDGQAENLIHELKAAVKRKLFA